MATNDSCPNCHGSGFHVERRCTGDGYDTNFYDQGFCACEYGEFCQWLFNLADDLEAEFYAVKHNCGHFESDSFSSTERFWQEINADNYWSAVNAERCL